MPDFDPTAPPDEHADTTAPSQVPTTPASPVSRTIHPANQRVLQRLDQSQAVAAPETQSLPVIAGNETSESEPRPVAEPPDFEQPWAVTPPAVSPAASIPQPEPAAPGRDPWTALPHLPLSGVEREEDAPPAEAALPVDAISDVPPTFVAVPDSASADVVTDAPPVGDATGEEQPAGAETGGAGTETREPASVPPDPWQSMIETAHHTEPAGPVARASTSPTWQDELAAEEAATEELHAVPPAPATPAYAATETPAAEAELNDALPLRPSFVPSVAPPLESTEEATVAAAAMFSGLAQPVERPISAPVIEPEEPAPVVAPAVEAAPVEPVKRGFPFIWLAVVIAVGVVMGALGYALGYSGLLNASTTLQNDVPLNPVTDSGVETR